MSLQSCQLMGGGNRALAYRAFGTAIAEARRVALYLHGWPSCSLEGRLLHAAAGRAGVALLAVDRAGIGGSSNYSGGARFSAFCCDIRQLLDELGVAAVLVVGFSGGGPYACACAAMMPERVSGLVLLAGMTHLVGPGSEELLQGQLWSCRLAYPLAARHPRLTRLLLAAARALLLRLPNAGRWGLPGRLLVTLAGGGWGFAMVDKLAMVRSAELGQLLLPLAQGCLRQGPDGLLSDLLLTSWPWGFELGRVRAPTLLVRGCQDGCVTERMVAWHQQRISGCRTLLVRGEGHLSLLLGSDQIFAAAIELLEDGGG